MRKKIAVFLIIMLTFHVFLAAASYEEGLQFLRLANKAKAMGNDADERTYLEKAYGQFSPIPDRKSRLMGIHTGLRLMKQAEIDEFAVALIKENRRTYRTLADDLELVNQDAKEAIIRYLERTESRIPFIDNLGIEKAIIFPFQGEQPGITFRLNAPAEVTLSVDRQPEQRKKPASAGISVLNLSWEVAFINRTSFDLDLAASNPLASDTKEARVQVTNIMPASLFYDSQSFGIRGKGPKPETKEIKKLQSKHLRAFLLWGVITAGLAYSSETTNDEDTAMSTGMIGAGTLILATVQLVRYFTHPKKVIVPDNANIGYNRALVNEIEAKKKDIAVKLQIEEKK
jgi:hypothetical protein